METNNNSINNNSKRDDGMAVRKVIMEDAITSRIKVSGAPLVNEFQEKFMKEVFVSQHGEECATYRFTLHFKLDKLRGEYTTYSERRMRMTQQTGWNNILTPSMHDINHGKLMALHYYLCGMAKKNGNAACGLCKKIEDWDYYQETHPDHTVIVNTLENMVRNHSALFGGILWKQQATKEYTEITYFFPGRQNWPYDHFTWIKLSELAKWLDENPDRYEAKNSTHQILNFDGRYNELRVSSV